MTLYDKYHIDRCDAMEYLVQNVEKFPTTIPRGSRSKHIGQRLFRDWCFVRLDDGNIVFANCLSPCITANDLKQWREVVPA